MSYAQDSLVQQLHTAVTAWSIGKNNIHVQAQWEQLHYHPGRYVTNLL